MLRPSPRYAVLAVVGLAFLSEALIYGMLPPLLPEYARIYHLSQTQLGLLFGSYAGALLLAALPLGKWADRHGRRGPFLGGLVGMGAATLIFAFADSYPLLLLARVLQGIAAAASWVAGLAMLADSFPADQRGKAMSGAFACANIGMFLGPAFGGFMVRVGSIRGAFLAAAGLVLVDALVRLTLLPPDPPAQPAGSGYLGLLKDSAVRVFAGAMVMGAVLGAVLEAVLPLHLSRHLAMDSVAIGLAFTTTALASTLTSPLVGHWTDRKGGLGPLRLGMALGAGLLALAPFLPSRVAVYAFMAVLGSTCSLLMSPCGPSLARVVEGKGGTSFGAVFSLLNVSFSLGMMAGPVLGSALTDALGIRLAFGILAGGFGGYLVLLGRSR